MKPTSSKDICGKIWQLEEKYNLLDLEIAHIKIWQASRRKIDSLEPVKR